MRLSALMSCSGVLFVRLQNAVASDKPTQNAFIETLALKFCGQWLKIIGLHRYRRRDLSR